jgi:hypothetical protein
VRRVFKKFAEKMGVFSISKYSRGHSVRTHENYSQGYEGNLNLISAKATRISFNIRLREVFFVTQYLQSKNKA